MRLLPLALLVPLLLGSATLASAHAPDAQAEMARLAAASPVFRKARATVADAAAGLKDAALRRATTDALLTARDCVRHRVGMPLERQRRVVAALAERRLVSGAPEAVRRGLFPPLEGEGSGCPHLATPVLAAPGGNSGSHHSWPGGLAVHIATNLASARALAQASGMGHSEPVTAAVLWHDWAKALVLGWRADGTTAPEFQVAGTGAHHVLGLAEAMRRRVDPRIVVAQACSHDAEGARVARWIEAAALIADSDPAAYQVTASPECLVTHLADQNWVFGDAAVAAAEARLAAEAPRFGFDPRQAARYNRCYRNPVLAAFGGDALFVAPAPQAWAPVLRRAATDCGAPTAKAPEPTSRRSAG